MRKKNRVKRNEEFQAIIARKQYVMSDSFVVYFQEGRLPQLRIGVSVGKKIGNAVMRNKVKRQLRMMLDELTDKDVAIDMVLIVRKRFLGKKYAENRKDLLVLLKKVKMNGNGILKSKEIIDGKAS